MNNSSLHLSALSFAALLAALVTFLSGCSSPDITIGHIEVTQAIQTSTNSITLLALRSTAVRVAVNTGGATVNNVTGKLHVFVNGSEVTPAAGIDPVSSITAVPSPDRNQENQLLNFELPAPTAITASNDVDFHVDVSVAGESNTSNNHGEQNDLHFVSRVNPSLFFTRVDYTPDGTGLTAFANVQPGTGDLFVRGIFPVNDADPNLYRQGLFPTLPFGDDPDGNHQLNSHPEGDNLLNFLESCRQLIVSNGLGAANNTFLVGWMNGSVDGNGLAPVPGFVCYANTDLTRSQRSYAHELTHDFGGQHNDETGNPLTLNPETGWDVGDRLEGHPAANNTTGRVKPSTFFDIMMAGKLTNEAWIDPTIYNLLLSSPVVSPDEGAAGDRKSYKDRVAVIQGVVDSTGNQLLRLDPVFRYPWPSQPSFRRDIGTFRIIVTDLNGATTSQAFDGRLCMDDPKGENAHGFFAVSIPVSASSEIATLSVIDTRSQKEVMILKRSAPPKISIITPAPKSKLGDKTEVKWKATDPDTPPDQLMFNVAYSADGGTTWAPVGVRITGDGFTFPSDQIQRSKENNGIIRVYVSDGLNTAFADVTGLSTSAAKY